VKGAYAFSASPQTAPAGHHRGAARAAESDRGIGAI